MATVLFLRIFKICIQTLKAITKHNERVIVYDTYMIFLFCNIPLSVGGVFVWVNFSEN